MKQSFVIAILTRQLVSSLAQVDLYRGIEWIPTHDPIYSYTKKRDEKFQVKRNIENHKDEQNPLVDNLIQVDKISRPKSFTIPKKLSKTDYKRYDNFLPPRPQGPPPNQLKKIKHYMSKASRVKRSMDFGKVNTSRVMKDIGISILAQGIGWMGWAALVSISNTNSPFSRSYKNEISFANLKDLPAFQNLIEKTLDEQFFEDNTTSVMKDVGVPLLAQGLSWLGWTAFSTINNQKSVGNQLQNTFDSMKDLPEFQNLLKQSLSDRFSERQLSSPNSSIGSDAVIFALVQVVGWTAWAAFATMSNPGTPIPFLG